MPELPPHLQPRETRFDEGETYQRIMLRYYCDYCGMPNQTLQNAGTTGLCENCSKPLDMFIRSNLVARLVGRKKPYKPQILESHMEINRQPWPTTWNDDNG